MQPESSRRSANACDGSRFVHVALVHFQGSAHNEDGARAQRLQYPGALACRCSGRAHIVNDHQPQILAQLHTFPDREGTAHIVTPLMPIKRRLGDRVPCPLQDIEHGKTGQRRNARREPLGLVVSPFAQFGPVKRHWHQTVELSKLRDGAHHPRGKPFRSAPFAVVLEQMDGAANGTVEDCPANRGLNVGRDGWTVARAAANRTSTPVATCAGIQLDNLFLAKLAHPATPKSAARADLGVQRIAHGTRRASYAGTNQRRSIAKG